MRLLQLPLLATCSLAAVDHERLGDEAYRAGRYPAALSEYLAVQRSGARPRVWAKVGAAGVHARDYVAAVDAYRQLAAADPSRADEAATGLERIARLAERAGGAELTTLTRAILVVRAVSPGRPLGRLAQGPGGSSQLERSDALGLLPAALATAGNPRAVDSLLLAYAEAQRLTTACDGAARTYRILLRRSDDTRFRGAAEAGLSRCALQLGLDALAAAQPDGAERWFLVVLGIESGTPRGWRAQIGRGDARLLQGDVMGAAIAFQAVLSSLAVPDSLRELAASKLNGLGMAPAPPVARERGP